MIPKLACADFAFPLLAHQDALRLIAAMEFQGVDIGLFEGRSHLWPSRILRNSQRSGQEMTQFLNHLGLCVADVFLQPAPDFVPLAINHPDPARRLIARDWFTRTLDYAGACACGHITTLPGVYHKGEPASVSWRRAIEELAWRVEQSQQYNIIFAVEAHVGSIAPDPKSAQQLINETAGLTLTLDYTHFTRSGFSDGAIEPLLPLASHFHARGARKGRLQCAVRQNSIDYRRIVRKLSECGYRGWMGIEYVWIDWERCNECDNLSETILLRDMIRSVTPD